MRSSGAPTKALPGHGPGISMSREAVELLARCTLTNDSLQVEASLMTVQKLAEFGIISLQRRDINASLQVMMYITCWERGKRCTNAKLEDLCKRFSEKTIYLDEHLAV